MKTLVERDRRCEFDKEFDKAWNKMCREAKLNPKQSAIVAHYLRWVIRKRHVEIESAVDMGWLIALIESEHFGTNVNRGAKRLMRVQQYAVDVRNEAYGHTCIDGNGDWNEYDNCGLEHLQIRLKRHGVEYDTNPNGE
jgi:hypothetical protein